MKKSLLLLSIVWLACSLSVAQAQWTTSGNNIYNSNTGYVGIGTTTPTNPLSVVGAASFTGVISSANFWYTGDNTVIGVNSGNTALSGFSTTIIGYNNAPNITTGSMNTIIGSGLAAALTTGTRNIIIGTKNTSWSGYTTGQALTTGYSNVIIGNGSGAAFTTNYKNIAIGDGSLQSSTGNNNVSIGYQAGFASAAGSNNAYIGTGAGQINTGSNNAFMGYFAGENSTGGSNTFMGYEAGYQAGAGAGNAYFGYSAGLNNTGSNNVFIGNQAGQPITSGANLTLVGSGAGTGTITTGLTNATAIGYNAQVTASNCLVLGAGVNVGINITDPHNALDVNGTIHSKLVNIDLNNWSDYVFKKNYRLRPLTEVKAYIDQHHHLPEIPSEAEMKRTGLNVGEMNKLLTKKVEELTLYMIERDKQEKDQTAAIRQHAEQLKSQQEQINKLALQMESLLKASVK